MTAADAVVLNAIETASAVLGDHPDEAVRRVGAWLATCPSEVLTEFGATNGVGQSARLDLTLRRRDALLRMVRIPTSRLAREYDHYRSTIWPRSRLAVCCPHAPDTREALYWRALRLVDRGLSLRRLQQIAKRGRF
jgi:hypothetical protein